MVKFPLKKCVRTVRQCMLAVYVSAILLTVDRWLLRPNYPLKMEELRALRGRMREETPTKDSETDTVEEYERQIAEDEARIIPGLGEGGAAAELSGNDKDLGVQSEKKCAFNVYLSDRIAYNRTLEDFRNPACKEVLYDASLPSTSVIIIFHNEPYSILLRTIWSVVNSVRRDRPWYQRANYSESTILGYPGQAPDSQLVYLKEIILVDDNSTLPELRGKLGHYIRTRFPPDLIRILRLPERGGLIRARQAGARIAVGSVLVFLDAHCEAQPDWLRPLLQRIKVKRDAVVTPDIDTLDKATLKFSAASDQVGGFHFDGSFTWFQVSEREKQRRGSDIAPTRSPTMAGGLFAMSREYFWQLGGYDEQMAGWGGENIEISFRIWQCGGTLEIIPCSLVGHMFRHFHPYALTGTDSYGINTARMAEVWMDDYKELFYLHRPDLRNSSKIGDLSSRKQIREKLQCKSFDWYLQNVYKEKFVPVRDAFGYGRFRNNASGMCLDNMSKFDGTTPLGLYYCHSGDARKIFSRSQTYELTTSGQLRDEVRCAVPDFDATTKLASSTGRRPRPAAAAGSTQPGAVNDVEATVVLKTCGHYQVAQKWVYMGNKQLVHWQSGLCLEGGESTAAARECGGERAQRWDIDYCELNHFRMSAGEEPSDVEKSLMKLRRPRETFE